MHSGPSIKISAGNPWKKSGPPPGLWQPGGIKILMETGSREDYEAHHRAILEGFSIPDSIKQSRKWIQENRKLEDHQLAPFFPKPAEPWASGFEHQNLFRRGCYPDYFQDCVRNFSLDEIFNPTLVTTEPSP